MRLGQLIRVGGLALTLAAGAVTGCEDEDEVTTDGGSKDSGGGTDTGGGGSDAKLDSSVTVDGSKDTGGSDTGGSDAGAGAETGTEAGSDAGADAADASAG